MRLSKGDNKGGSMKHILTGLMLFGFVMTITQNAYAPPVTPGFCTNVKNCGITGVPGPAGPAGPAGLTGSQGPAGICDPSACTTSGNIYFKSSNLVSLLCYMTGPEPVGCTSTTGSEPVEPTCDPGDMRIDIWRGSKGVLSSGIPAKQFATFGFSVTSPGLTSQTGVLITSCLDTSSVLETP